MSCEAPGRGARCSSPTCTPSWSPWALFRSRRVVLREGLRLRLSERPGCREVVPREGLRLSLPERPCCREGALRERLRLSLSSCRAARRPSRKIKFQARISNRPVQNVPDTCKRCMCTRRVFNVDWRVCASLPRDPCASQVANHTTLKTRRVHVHLLQMSETF